MPSNVLSLLEILPGVRENVPLAPYTTFNIGGPAEYFFIAGTREQVVLAITAARRLGLPVFVFAGGSNIVFPDEGLKGLVIKIHHEDGIALAATEGGALVTAPAGLELGTLVDFVAEHGLQGLEWAGGLPGSFGGAIRGNAGAFGGEMKDSVFSVEALDGNLELKTCDNKTCEFAYRDSIFKRQGWIILSASVRLRNGDKQAVKEIAESRRAYRKKHHPLEYPSAGSIFKNIPVEAIPQKFMELFRDKVKQDPFPIVPAAWFIIAAGLPGAKVGQAQISEKHSNYVINAGGATAKDVRDLVAHIREVVKKTYGIDLEPEVQFVT
jgi:UDP-N-acetylmuramate dehydrogenase